MSGNKPVNRSSDPGALAGDWRGPVLALGIVLVTLIFGLGACSDAKPIGPIDDGSPAGTAPTTQHIIHEQASTAPQVAVGEQTYHGDPAMANCSACHATRPASRDQTTAPALFHQDLQMAHGGLSCLSCHNPDNYDQLRLADGRSLAFTDSMMLCGQCHGPKMRDYKKGIHGGMAGYWDAKQGPVHRQSCLTCHDPHSPAYPALVPAPPPRDTAGDAHGH